MTAKKDAINNTYETKLQLSSLVKSPDIQKIGLMLSTSNIFEILKITKKEIRHSFFLAWLLDPHESHQLGDVFLKWFLKDIFSDERIEWINEFDVDSLDVNSVNIHREHLNIDIMIETVSFVIVIENKVSAREGNNQLSRYVEKIERIYPGKEHAFIFLTPDAVEPDSEIDKLKYIIYSYPDVVNILESILLIKKDNLDPQNLQYIKDYINTVRRYIMRDDELVEIAQKIYKNHKDALDFIFENKPDRLLTVAPAFERACVRCGYILGSVNKGYARFTTKKLHEYIPRSSRNTWKNNELFLFELNFWKTKVRFRTVVADEEKEVRDELINSLVPLKNGKQPRGQKWSIVNSSNVNINVHNEKYSDMDLIENDIYEFLKSQEDFILSVEEALLAVNFVN